MPTTLNSTEIQRIRLVGDDTQRSGTLSTLSYRSLAVTPLSELDLKALQLAAEVRNRAESVTGMMIYDAGHIFQWLEGPTQGLARIWTSIRNDPRHTNIEVLGDRLTPMRFFGDSDMRLSSRCGLSAQAPAAVLEFTPLLIAQPTPTPAGAASLTGGRRTHPGVLRLVQSIAGHDTAVPVASRSLTPAIDALADALVRQLVSVDPQAARATLAAGHAQACSIDFWFASVIEPTARGLGDLWQNDHCSEFQVSLGLERLQSNLRDFTVDVIPACLPVAPTVLVVPQPGEAHLLGAALDAELLWRAGWDTHVEFPATNQALETMLASARFDVLDLSLSLAFRREHWLPRLADTIAAARRASRHRDLVVVVRGRVFSEPGDVLLQVGADANCASALELESTILRALTRSHAQHAS